MSEQKRQPVGGLYRPEFERDSCGFGLIAHMDNQPSHWLVDTAITALARVLIELVSAEHKTGTDLVIVAGAILVLSVAVLILRFASNKYPSHD